MRWLFCRDTQLLPLTFGFGVIGAFLWLSYRHKLETYNEAGVTTEISGLVTYVIGALVSRDQLWIATTIAVISMLLLELKEFLENLTTKIPGRGNSDVHEISSADLRHPAGRAEQGLRPVRHESVQVLAGRRGDQRRVLRKLPAGETVEGKRRHKALRAAGRAVFLDLHDGGDGQRSEDGRALRTPMRAAF